jgi:DNA topoisomerase-3
MKTRGFLAPDGKSIVSTPHSRAFVSCLPDSLRRPDMTARFETGLAKVERGEITCDAFVSAGAALTKRIVAEICSVRMPPPPPPGAAPKTTGGRAKTTTKKPRARSKRPRTKAA